MLYNHTATTALTERPDCDICTQEGRKGKAAVDGATRMGPWAYLCIPHFEMYGVGLGLGRGQRLLIDEEERDDGAD